MLKDSTIEDLKSFLKQFQLSEALATIGSECIHLWQKKTPIEDVARKHIYHFQGIAFEKKDKVTIALWQLAYIAKLLILVSNDFRPKNFDKDSLLKAAAMFNNLLDRILLTDSESEPFAADSFFIRTGYQQFTFQAEKRHLVPRALYLFKEINEELGTDKFDIPKTFVDMYGLTIEDFIYIGFAISAYLRKTAFFNPDEIINAKVPKLANYLTKEKVGRFLNIVTINYADFRKLTEIDQSNVHGLEHFEFNPLVKHPIIRTTKVDFVVPVPVLLLDRVTSGIYYDMLDEFSSRSLLNEFTSFLGGLFEKYVGKLLTEFYDELHLLPERHYGKCSRTVDWIILEDNSAVLIECKSSRLTKRAKTFAEQDKLQEDLRKGVARGVKQLFRNKCDIENKIFGLEDLFDIKDLYFLIIVLDPLYFANSIQRKLIDEELKKDKISNFEYQIMSVSELEYFTTLLSREKLYKILNNKIQDLDKREWDFEQFTNDYKGEQVKLENKLLSKKFHEFFDMQTNNKKN